MLMVDIILLMCADYYLSVQLYSKFLRGGKGGSMMLLGCGIVEILQDIFISHMNGRLERPSVHRK